MPNPTLPLKLNARGPEVKNLHASLDKLGFKIPPHEVAEQLFGVGTQAALLKLQAKYRLPSSGALDEVTKGAIEKAIAEAGAAQYRVEGRLFLDNGLPARQVTVRPYHRGFANEPIPLGLKKNGVFTPSEAKTDDQGLYLLLYEPPNLPVNLELRVVDAQNKETPVSRTKFNAEKQETLNLVVPASVQPLDPEYNRLTNDLGNQLGGLAKLANAQEKAQRRDITLLGEATKWDGRLIALAATAVKLGAETSIPQDVLYAMFRAGLPMGKAELAQVSGAAVDKALAKAKDAGVVALNAQQIAAAKTAFQKFVRTARRAARAPGASSSFGDLLDKTGLSDAEKSTFEELYFAHRGTAAELWTKAQLRIPRAKIDALRLQGKLAYLTLNNAELTASLQQGLRSLDDLVQTMDLHKNDEWKKRLIALAGNDEQALKKLIPPAYAGEKTADRLEAYAADLARKVRLSFPTQVVGRMIEKDELRLGADHDVLKAPVGKFLKKAQPLGFQLGRTALAAFIENNRDGLFPRNTPKAEIEAATRGVKWLQRTYQVTPTDEALKVVLELGFTSARDILAFPYDVFLSRFGAKFDPGNESASLEIARLVYRKAEQVGAVTFNFLAGAKQLVSNAPALAAISPPAERREAARTNLVKQYPTLEALFGSLDFCECEHCRSVLSPAAYLVDLLQFLEPEKEVWNGTLSEWTRKHGNAPYPFKDQATWNVFRAEWAAQHPGEPSPEEKKPYEILVGRRPDIPNLPLTCENTHTALPYIDVVNEILEYYVANDKLAADATRDTGTATTAELLAEPQNVIPKAYEELNRAKYPLSLPFDLWLETVRGFLDHFAMPLSRILEVFRKGQDLTARAPIFAESLGISPAEYVIITDPNPLAKWYELYGYPSEATALAALKSAKTLALRLGVTYKELRDIVRTGFVNPRLNSLVLLRKLDVEIDDLCRYKGQGGYQPFSADEKAAFEQRLTDFAKSFDPNLGLADAQRWLDIAWQGARLNEILLLVDRDANCNFENTVLRYADGTDADRIAFLKINVFVRLWKKLGWSMEDTDRALRAFVPRNADPITGANLGAALKTALLYLAHLKALDEQLKLGRYSRQMLLTLWSDLPTTGAKPLYAKLFLTRSLLKIDPVFDDPLGNYLAKAGVLIKDHLLALQAALNLTADEIEEILQDAGKTVATAELSLANVSLLYRYGLLAKALKLSGRDLIALKALSGLDPFKPLSADPVAKIEDDYPLTHTLGFVELAQEVKESGLGVEDLEYVLRHRFDPVGKYRPDNDALLGLVKSLASGVREVLAQQVIPNEPDAITNDVVREKISLVLPSDVVDTFLGFWADTKEFEAVTGDPVPANRRLDPTIYQVKGVRVVYDAVREQQHVIHTGVLTVTRVDEIKREVPNPNTDPAASEDQKRAYVNFTDLLDKIAVTSKQQRKDFFNDYLKPFLATPYDVLYDAGGSPKPASRKTLLEAVLPSVREKLIRQFVTQMLASNVGADPVLTEALLVDLLKDPSEPAKPLLNAFTAVGVSAEFFDNGNVSFAKATVISPDTSGKPNGTARVRFEGSLEVPADGAYRFFVALDKKDAEATLRLTGVANAVVDGKATTDNDEISGFVELTRGLLYEFSLDIRKLAGGDARLKVQGASLPKGTVDRLSLYPKDATDRVGRGRVLLAKTVQLAQSLAFNEREVRYILSHPADFDNIDLSKLPTIEIDDSLSKAQVLFGYFRRLARYARLKRDVAGGGDDLVTVFENGAKAKPLDDLCQRVADLTRRELVTVRAAAQALGLGARDFAEEKGVTRLWRALQAVESLGVPVEAIVGWTEIINPARTADERLVIARDLKNVVKAGYEFEDWQRIAQPIFDALRRRQRDTLVAYIMPRKGFERLEQLFEYFLIDPGMEPVVQTSRLRLAISSVQLFIQRSLLNLEQLVAPSAINSSHWQWMKRYRVWEANRKIFLYPENWLEPEFRDDKTHLFQELEGALLQGDVSNDLVEDAFFNYLKKLEALARLEIVAMYCEEKTDPELNVLHVIGRTYNEPHQYFYRRYANRMWAPWEPVGAEIEGDHLAAVVWRERLHLFWVTFLEKADEAANEEATPQQMGDKKVWELKPPRVIEAQLNWSQYFQGEWTTRESSGFGEPIRVTVGEDFDVGKVFIHATTTGANGAGTLRIHLGDPVNRAFEVVSKNSPAAVVSSEAPQDLPYVTSGVAATKYTGSGSLWIRFVERIQTDDSGQITLAEGSKTIFGTVDGFSLVACANPLMSAPFASGEEIQGTTPLYRLYNSWSGDHFYTTSAAERDNAIAAYGYQAELTECFVYSSQAPGATPLYRLRSPSTGDHFYTTSEAERDNAIANSGYVSEGIACFMFSAAAPGATPLYRLLSRSTGDHFYTSSADERDFMIAYNNYVDEGVAGFVFATHQRGTAIAPLISPFFYQDNQHAFYVEPTLTEATIDQWEEWVISTPLPEPGFDRDDWWTEVPIFAEVPIAEPSFAVDPLAHFGFQLKRDWVTDPATFLRFDERLIDRTGGVDFAVLPAGNRAGDRGTVVNAGSGSELPPGVVLVTPGAAKPGVGQPLVPLGRVNVIGGRGLNSQVLKNLTMRRSSTISPKGRGGLAGSSIS